MLIANDSIKRWYTLLFPFTSVTAGTHPTDNDKKIGQDGEEKSTGCTVSN